MGKVLKETKDYKIGKLSNEFKGVCIGLSIKTGNSILLDEEELLTLIDSLVEARMRLNGRRK